MKTLQYLENLWSDDVAREMDEPELLRYRSNLLGADPRLTNFGVEHQFKDQKEDSITAQQSEVLGERQRRRFGKHQEKWIRDTIP
jgi:hypothetical protein